MQLGPIHFREVWLLDFEFSVTPGERPQPICLVAWELHSGRKLRVWQDLLLAIKVPPYSLDKDSLLVAYYASAEMGCHLSLGWPMPANLLDLFTEFRNLTNGLTPPCGNGLLGALAWFGLSSVEAAEKETMRQLALRGGPWTPEEKTALLDYCESDVAPLARLLPKMAGSIDLPRALLRGRYMKAAAQIEYLGTPIETSALSLLQQHWETIQDALIQEIDADDLDRSSLITIWQLAGRVREINNLIWEDVDFNRRKVRLWTRKKSGANLTPRLVDMEERAFKALKLAQWHRDKHSPYVFTNPFMAKKYPANPEKWKYDYRDKFFDNLCRKAEVKEMGYHALRHQKASELADRGESLPYIRDFLGHEDISTTSLYLQSLGIQR